MTDRINMFTGIIEAVGTVVSSQEHEKGRTLWIETPFRDLVLGESIAINGTCLTVTEPNQRPSFFVSTETLQKTNLGALQPGSRVNLERALQAGARLSGHIVQGHVDATAKILSIAPLKDALGGETSYEVKVTLPVDLLKYVVTKGSVTLDGVSLTVNRIEADAIALMIIPHTWRHTIFSTYQPGTAVNIEVDIIAKYVARQAELNWERYEHNSRSN